MTAADQDLGDQHRPVHSALPPAARDFQGKRAGVVTRCLVAAVDLGVVAVILAAVYFAIAGVVLLWDPKHADLPTFPRSVAVTASGVLAILYLATAWSTRWADRRRPAASDSESKGPRESGCTFSGL